MGIQFAREAYFDAVRKPLFGGALTQQQVDGQNFILTQWEKRRPDGDLRHLAYMLATTKHETASTMWPIEEYGKGAGRAYGRPDPVTGQAYYGRGFVQLTWRDNYRRATQLLGLSGDNDLEFHPSVALVPEVAADIMFAGMEEGWFRTAADGKPQTLERYFSQTRHDAYGAREIINGDKTVVTTWSKGVSIGQLIEGYHTQFLNALLKARRSSDDDQALTPAPAPAPTPMPTPDPSPQPLVVRVLVPKGVKVEVEVVE